MNTYQLIDSGNFLKLEQVGPYRLLRPAASAVWGPTLPAIEWDNYHARFSRDRGGDGEWEIKDKSLPEHWDIEVSNLMFRIRLTGFGHLGIFPEQADNWLDLQKLIQKKSSEKKEINVLNLFAYTGGSSLACAKAGAKVTHLDASKTSVTWAKENSKLCDLDDNSIRWIVDDVLDFVAREVRRGQKYQGIILDPPSFGRGPKKQVWKIEKDLMPLLSQLKQLTGDDFLFCLLSSHSQGYTPVAHANQLQQIFSAKNSSKNLKIKSNEMLLQSENGLNLPSGSYSFIISE